MEKTLDLRMQELILSTIGNGNGNGDGDDGESSFSGGAVRNTSDRRTDPNISCICLCIRERESIGFALCSECEKSEEM